MYFFRCEVALKSNKINISQSDFKSIVYSQMFMLEFK